VAAYDYDLVVVGAGAGGLTGARFAARVGARVAIVERQRVGGDCTWTGCVPSKALLRAARAAQEVRMARRFGIVAGEPRTDMSAVREYVRAAIGQVYERETPDVLEREGITVVEGTAAFVDSHTLTSGGRTLSARAFLISTGATPWVPPIAGLDQVRFHTHEQIFDNDRLPGSFLVLGGGPIGVEIAQAYRRLGSDVTIVTDQLLPREDADARAVIESVLDREGVKVVWGEATSARLDGQTTVLATDRGEARGDQLLVALGRRPVVEGLRLDLAGVRYSRAGIPVDDRLRTNVRHIYASGDVTGGLQFTHLAGFQGFQAARNALLPGSSAGRASLVPRVTFTDPEIAHVGATLAEAQTTDGDSVREIHWPLGHADRAVCEGDQDGFIRLVVASRGRILGATVVAGRAGEMIAELGLAVAKRLKLADVAATIHAYPTYSTAVQQLAVEATLDRFVTGTSGRLANWLARGVRKGG
jgi:pyruvate/2-oxoglutarate dehydrogenase complex dihydrolipoamide dehydrogenase (E3) component